MDLYSPSSFSLDNIVTLTHIFISVFCGIAIRIFISISGQNWINTSHHTIVYALLPAITFVVTKIISGNIALSLGMIGALSIVRFRNPVKNPLELVMYFGLITIGIACSVRIKFGLLLTIVIGLILIITKIYNYLAKKYNFNLPNLSFGDGNIYNIAEITFSCPIDSLNSKKQLVQYIEDYDQNNFIYRFASTNKQNLDELISDVKKNKNIKNINVNYIN